MEAVLARKHKHKPIPTRPGFELVREAGPLHGEVVVHERNRRQRMIDALDDDGLLSAEQYTAATDLRDAWERSGIALVAPALDMTKPHVDGGGAAREYDNAALTLYEGTMRQLAQDERRCLKAVVCMDEHPVVYGARMRCDGLAFLRRCLVKAGKQMERIR